MEKMTFKACMWLIIYHVVCISVPVMGKEVVLNDAKIDFLSSCKKSNRFYKSCLLKDSYPINSNYSFIPDLVLDISDPKLRITGVFKDTDNDFSLFVGEMKHQLTDDPNLLAREFRIEADDIKQPLFVRSSGAGEAVFRSQAEAYMTKVVLVLDDMKIESFRNDLMREQQDLDNLATALVHTEGLSSALAMSRILLEVSDMHENPLDSELIESLSEKILAIIKSPDNSMEPEDEDVMLEAYFSLKSMKRDNAVVVSDKDRIILENMNEIAKNIIEGNHDLPSLEEVNARIMKKKQMMDLLTQWQ